jgi:hypothetical protein
MIEVMYTPHSYAKLTHRELAKHATHPYIKVKTPQNLWHLSPSFVVRKDMGYAKKFGHMKVQVEKRNSHVQK